MAPRPISTLWKLTTSRKARPALADVLASLTFLAIALLNIMNGATHARDSFSDHRLAMRDLYQTFVSRYHTLETNLDTRTSIEDCLEKVKAISLDRRPPFETYNACLGRAVQVAHGQYHDLPYEQYPVVANATIQWAEDNCRRLHFVPTIRTAWSRGFPGLLNSLKETLIRVKEDLIRLYRWAGSIDEDSFSKLFKGSESVASGINSRFQRIKKTSQEKRPEEFDKIIKEDAATFKAMANTMRREKIVRETHAIQLPPKYGLECRLEDGLCRLTLAVETKEQPKKTSTGTIVKEAQEYLNKERKIESILDKFGLGVQYLLWTVIGFQTLFTFSWSMSLYNGVDGTSFEKQDYRVISLLVWQLVFGLLFFAYSIFGLQMREAWPSMFPVRVLLSVTLGTSMLAVFFLIPCGPDQEGVSNLVGALQELFDFLRAEWNEARENRNSPRTPQTSGSPKPSETSENPEALKNIKDLEALQNSEITEMDRHRERENAMAEALEKSETDKYRERENAISGPSGPWTDLARESVDSMPPKAEASKTDQQPNVPDTVQDPELSQIDQESEVEDKAQESESPETTVRDTPSPASVALTPFANPQHSSLFEDIQRVRAAMHAQLHQANTEAQDNAVAEWASEVKEGGVEEVEESSSDDSSDSESKWTVV